MLPNVDMYRFIRQSGCWYYVSEDGKKHHITKATLIANGVRDLCVTLDKETGMATIRKTVDVVPEDIMWIPKRDILLLDIEPPLYNNRDRLLMEVESGVEPLVKALVTSESHKAKDYDMYGGKDYLGS